METKFTKGKWEITPEKNNPNSPYKNSVSIISKQQGWFIAEVMGNAGFGNRPTPESEANAKLIAAAPELLEALQAVTQELRYALVNHCAVLKISPDTIDGNTVIIKAEAAIQKAID